MWSHYARETCSRADLKVKATCEITWSDVSARNTSRHGTLRFLAGPYLTSRYVHGPGTGATGSEDHRRDDRHGRWSPVSGDGRRLCPKPPSILTWEHCERCW